jgi:hypothetical protein
MPTNKIILWKAFPVACGCLDIIMIKAVKIEHETLFLFFNILAYSYNDACGKAYKSMPKCIETLFKVVFFQLQ